MIMDSPGETKQEHGSQEGSRHGQGADHGHTGEGAASVLEYLIRQDQRHRRQAGDSAEGPAGSVHP